MKNKKSCCSSSLIALRYAPCSMRASLLPMWEPAKSNRSIVSLLSKSTNNHSRDHFVVLQDLTPATKQPPYSLNSFFRYGNSSCCLPRPLALNLPNQVQDGFHIHPLCMISVKIFNALLSTVLLWDIILWNIDPQRVHPFSTTANLLGN